MDGRIFKAVLLLLVLLVACLMTAPVLSGEHPWDSDRGDDGGGDPTDDTTVSGVDTIPVIEDTTILGGSPGGSDVVTVTASSWISFWTGIWSAFSAAF